MSADDLTGAALALRRALAEVLDLDAGLADVRRTPSARLTAAVGHVLDVDAGLEAVLRAPRDAPVPARRTALGAFADRITALPVQDRLAVRAWLPRHELLELRTVASLCLALDFDDLLDALTGAPAHTLDRVVALVHAEIGGRAGRLLPAPDRCTDSAIRTAIDRTDDLVAAVIHDLTTAQGAGGVRTAAAGARAAVGALRRYLAEVRQLAFGHTRRFPVHVRKLAHVSTFCIALTTDREYDRDVGRDPLVDRELVAAVEAIDAAMTDVAGIDLSQVDLTGIPLTGLRWSAATRWPPSMAAEVRRSSVQILPSRYEIGPGGVGVGVDA